MVRTGIEVIYTNDGFKFGEIKKFRCCGEWSNGKRGVKSWEDANGYDGKLYSASKKGNCWFFILECVD